MVAQVTFRSDNVFTDRFGRELADGATLHDGLDLWQRFEVERYLDYHGDKLVRRFDTNSYLIIGKAMDLHDVGRGRDGLAAAMAPHHGARAGDGHLQRHPLPDVPAAADPRPAASPAARTSEYVEIDSPHGHDAFLINLDQVAPPLRRLPRPSGLTGPAAGVRARRRAWPSPRRVRGRRGSCSASSA